MTSGDLRLGPAPPNVLGQISLSTRGTSQARDRWASSREFGEDVDQIAARRSASSSSFNISCRHCWTVRRGLMSAVRDDHSRCARQEPRGAALFGFTEQQTVPGGPGHSGCASASRSSGSDSRVPDGVADEPFLYRSGIASTAWQGVAYLDIARRRHANRPRPWRPESVDSPSPHRPAPRLLGHRRRPGAERLRLAADRPGLRSLTSAPATR